MVALVVLIVVKVVVIVGFGSRRCGLDRVTSRRGLVVLIRQGLVCLVFSRGFGRDIYQIRGC